MAQKEFTIGKEKLVARDDVQAAAIEKVLKQHKEKEANKKAK